MQRAANILDRGSIEKLYFEKKKMLNEWNFEEKNPESKSFSFALFNYLFFLGKYELQGLSYFHANFLCNTSQISTFWYFAWMN